MRRTAAHPLRVMSLESHCCWRMLRTHCPLQPKLTMAASAHLLKKSFAATVTGDCDDVADDGLLWLTVSLHLDSQSDHWRATSLKPRFIRMSRPFVYYIVAWEMMEILTTMSSCVDPMRRCTVCRSRWRKGGVSCTSNTRSAREYVSRTSSSGVQRCQMRSVKEKEASDNDALGLMLALWTQSEQVGQLLER